MIYSSFYLHVANVVTFPFFFQAFYPGHTTAIGGGSLDNVQIKAKSNTTLNFPFSINYNSTADPNLEIINDIVKKCGLTGGAKQPIKIDYTLKLSLKVLAIPFTISSDRDTNIDCPIQVSQSVTDL